MPPMVRSDAENRALRFAALPRHTACVSGRIGKRALSGANALVVSAFERELRRRGMTESDRHVEHAWQVQVQTMAINAVECTDQERGGRLWRAQARFASAQSIAALTRQLFCLRTPGNLYWTAAAFIVVARVSDEIVELAWVYPKPPPDQTEIWRIPAGVFADVGFNYFAARVRPDDGDAQQMVDRITEKRDGALATMDPTSRETFERVAGKMRSARLW